MVFILVNEVFDNVASKYDIMNDAMSFGKKFKNLFQIAT